MAISNPSHKEIIPQGNYISGRWNEFVIGQCGTRSYLRISDFVMASSCFVSNTLDRLRGICFHPCPTLLNVCEAFSPALLDLIRKQTVDARSGRP